MKKIFITLLIIGRAIPGVFAQSNATSFDVDGIKVIFKPTVKEIVNVRMFYRGGVTNYPASQAGIESFALEATTECGTKKYTGNVFRDRADKYSIDIGSEAEYDYGDIEMDCAKKYFNEGWDLFAEAINNPVFEANEVELLRNKIIGKIRSEQSDPDKRSEQLILKNAFDGTPYATDPNGDDNIIAKLTPANLKAYYASIFNKNQVFIVVAGKISKEELIAKIKATFAAMPARSYTPPVYHTPVWNDYKVLSEGRDLATNYINAIMNSPAVNSPDYVAYRIGVSGLGGTLFSSLRTKLNLSYDPGASSVMGQMPYSLMFVSTTKPKEAVDVMVNELNRVRSNGLTDEGLVNLKSGYITNNYIKQQSTAAITGSLGIAEVLGGWQLSDQLPEMISKVTVDQIDKAMNKYIVGLRWSYLGSPALGNQAADSFKKPVK